ncbi:hypothetical protein EYR40_004870 [Pleurotus pulmonarius]|nr:hypothetical protein EYR36_006744 [Pleurotus pulmonarius]KAF4601671.1 hypothetical protein EYR40_004870 [Pleurotus pulmonarius]
MSSSSSYQFLPRKLIKRKPNGSADANLPTAKPPDAQIPLPVVSAAAVDNKKQQNPPDEHIAIWVNLAVSDYAVWSDPDLRRVLDSGQDKLESNYIPLRLLLRHSQLPGVAEEFERVPEAQVVKALRAHSPTTLEIRVLISEPSKAAWSTAYNAKGKDREDMGGYEIRRLGGGKLGSLTREDWKGRTVYFERIPIQHRTVPAIVQFILSLLATGDATRIQSVTLPPHHFDEQGSIPKFKGFAFVVFSVLEDANTLLERWPWERDSEEEKQSSSLHSAGTGITEGEREARRFGLRALSQARWDELKEEYLSYRKTLIERAHDDGAPPNILPTPTSDPGKAKPEPEPEHQTLPTSTVAPAPGPREDDSPPRPSLDDPYPYGCLVFVRNVHPATNKTTLRALFASVFSDTDTREAIDYVDFTKGMDTCYLRLSRSSSAVLLSSHFAAHRTVQSYGLDEVGVQGDGGKGIEVEVVRGKREAVYWEKVPEKVRRGAVVKAVGAVNEGGCLYADGHAEGDRGTREDREEGRQRKRRKRG